MLDAQDAHFSVEPDPDTQGVSAPCAPAPLTPAIEAFATWMQASRPRHLRYLRGQLPSTEDAEDALQDAAVKFFQNAHLLDKLEKRDAWVGISLRHTVIDRYRRTAARNRLVEALLHEPPAAPNEQDDAARTAAECLKATIPTLKTGYARLLQQAYFEGISLKDVAKQEGLTENNVTVRLHRARGALRQALRLQCKDCPILDCWGRQRLTELATA